MIYLYLAALMWVQFPRMPRNVKPPPPPPPLTTSISLRIKTAAGDTVVTSVPKQAPAPVRPSAALKSGEKPQIRWFIQNVDLKKPVSNIVVHFLITKEAAPGAAIPSAPQKGSYQDSVMGTDLAPHEATSGAYNTAIYEPGTYLVEVELLDDQGNRRQYCAVDLKVE